MRSAPVMKSSGGTARDMTSGRGELARLLARKKRIVVIAGAGISASAGLPCYSSRGQADRGFFDRRQLHASYYGDESTRRDFYMTWRNTKAKIDAMQPTPFHHYLARLARHGRLLRHYTQNVDGIETRFPELTEPQHGISPWPITVQLHGDLHKAQCQRCRKVTNAKLDEFGDADQPVCLSCMQRAAQRVSLGKRNPGHGQLRPYIYFYDDSAPLDDSINDIIEADITAQPDAVIVVGTSMKTSSMPKFVRDFCAATHQSDDGLSIWVNPEQPSNCSVLWDEQLSMTANEAVETPMSQNDQQDMLSPNVAHELDGFSKTLPTEPVTEFGPYIDRVTAMASTSAPSGGSACQGLKRKAEDVQYLYTKKLRYGAVTGQRVDVYDMGYVRY